LFYGAYKVDLFSQLVKCVMSAGFTLMLLFGADTKGISVRMRPEYYFFLLSSLLGLTLLSSSVELITLFIALELSSYSLYLLVPMRTPSDNMRAPMEAAIKYLLFGVTASGIMLFGMSWIFGIAGSTYLEQILPAMRSALSHADSPHAFGAQAAALVGLLMLFCGMFFKLAVFPFHFWAPDVYQGASNDTTAFIASMPKIVAVAVLARFCSLAFPGEGHIALLLTGLSIASMFYGNLTALVQTDVKRMLGFSGIAHAGYILMGMATMQGWGIATSLYYATGYLFMMLTAFLVLCTVSPDGKKPDRHRSERPFAAIPHAGLCAWRKHVCPGGHSAFCGLYGQISAADRRVAGGAYGAGDYCGHQHGHWHLLLSAGGARRVHRGGPAQCRGHYTARRRAHGGHMPCWPVAGSGHSARKHDPAGYGSRAGGLVARQGQAAQQKPAT